MCSFPGCQDPRKTFQLKGPAGAPPKKGWALTELPVGDDIIRSAWRSIPHDASGSVEAIYQAERFLATNGVTGVTDILFAHALEQWCGPEPKRCPGYETPPGLPWARQMWEESNKMLAEADEENAGATLYAIVENLTTAIEGPEGCPKCAAHWKAYRDKNPPVVHTLEEARRWLWAAHNHSREGKAPVPYEVIATKFNWK